MMRQRRAVCRGHSSSALHVCGEPHGQGSGFPHEFSSPARCQSRPSRAPKENRVHSKMNMSTDHHHQMALELALAGKLVETCRLLIQQPLKELRSSLGCNSSAISDAGLRPLDTFISRFLDTLEEVQRRLVGAAAGEQLANANGWLADTRQDLELWGQCAGRALHGLAAGAEMGPMGVALQELGGQVAEALGRGAEPHLSQQREQHLTNEVAELRGELHFAERHSALQWTESYENLARLLQTRSDEQSDRHQMHQMMEEFQTSQIEFSNMLQRARDQHHAQMHTLQRHAEHLHQELRESERKCQSEHKQVEASDQEAKRARATLQQELQQERHVHGEVLAHMSEKAAQDLDLEHRECASMSLKLKKVVGTVNSKEAEIDELRCSLEKFEKAAKPNPHISALSGSSAGPIPPMFEALRELTARSLPSLPRDFTNDGAGSVCRVSTESVKFTSPGQSASPAPNQGRQTEPLHSLTQELLWV